MNILKNEKIDNAEIMNIVNDVIPSIYFHTNENYLPESLDYYIENSDLYKGDKKVVNAVTLNQISNDFKDEFYVLRNELKFGSLERARLYVRFQELETYYRIVFFVFFSFNGPLKLFGCCNVGEHNADVERFAFYLNKETKKIEKIYLGAHGSKDGMWLTMNDFEIEKNEEKKEKLVLYCALNSHAFYNEAKTYFRYLGAVNDHTNKGMKWVDPKFILIDENNPVWQNFRGNLGYPDNCQVPKHRGWENEPEKSTSFWKRFFGCC